MVLSRIMLLPLLSIFLPCLHIIHASGTDDSPSLLNERSILEQKHIDDEYIGSKRPTTTVISTPIPFRHSTLHPSPSIKHLSAFEIASRIDDITTPQPTLKQPTASIAWESSTLGEKSVENEDGSSSNIDVGSPSIPSKDQHFRSESWEYDTSKPIRSKSPSTYPKTNMQSVVPSNISTLVWEENGDDANSLTKRPSSSPLKHIRNGNMPSRSPKNDGVGSKVPSANQAITMDRGEALGLEDNLTLSQRPSQRSELEPIPSSIPTQRLSHAPSESADGIVAEDGLGPSGKFTNNTKPPSQGSLVPSVLKTIDLTSYPSTTSMKPTHLPSYIPTKVPSQMPTPKPTNKPSHAPTKSLSEVPTLLPTKNSSTVPSKGPSQIPTPLQTYNPSTGPTKSPSKIPTPLPTPDHSAAPTTMPSQAPNSKKSPILQPIKGDGIPKKPNILLILADDVGTGDIPLYWNSSSVKMPNIKKLSEQGVTFRDAHGTPLCAPSRYMLLSGNYQHRGRHANGSWNLEYEHNQFQPYQKSISQVLKEGGYHTGMFGKWHLGARVPPFGTQNHTHYLTAKEHNWALPLHDGPQDIGFDSSLITVGGIQEAPYSFFRNGMLTTKVKDVKFWETGEYWTNDGDQSMIIKDGEGDPGWNSASYNMVLVNETEAFLDDHFNTQSEDPFFLYVSLGSVHIPHSPPMQYLDGTQVAGLYPYKHMDMLHEMDKVVGSLVDMIEARKIAEETIIIFTSDNGGIGYKSKAFDFDYQHLSSGPLRGRKGDIYEGGHRVPLIMRHDGKFPAKALRNHPIGLNDLYSTICELTGLEVPSRSAQDSESFANYIVSNNERYLRESLAVFDYKKGRLEAESLRQANLKVVRHLKPDSMKASSIELYDLTSDLSEKNDLSGDIRYSDITTQMLEKLTRLGPCPDDMEGIFTLPTKHMRKEFETSCNYFRRKPHKCSKYVEGELFCHSICGRHFKTCNPELFPIKRRKRAFRNTSAFLEVP